MLVPVPAEDHIWNLVPLEPNYKCLGSKSRNVPVDVAAIVDWNSDADEDGIRNMLESVVKRSVMSTMLWGERQLTWIDEVIGIAIASRKHLNFIQLRLLKSHKLSYLSSYYKLYHIDQVF